MTQLQWQLQSSIGNIFLVASDKGLQGVFLRKQAIQMATSLKSKQPEIQILANAAMQLDEYFAGKRQNFDLPFDIEGTAFQKQVWKALSNIPFGKTVSYSDIAKKINNPKAVRAVGSANGKNPLCIIIPCHRVIAADGSLGGYSSGIDIKKKLLKLENTAAI
jgi:methylated-DNA-[protein]-cysteine S-methyltransferase